MSNACFFFFPRDGRKRWIKERAVCNKGNLCVSTGLWPTVDQLKHREMESVHSTQSHSLQLQPTFTQRGVYSNLMTWREACCISEMT